MIALLYDVHGNLPALEAVIADAQAAGATEWLVGGDIAMFGPYPRETVERLRELEPARWLRGNVDRWSAFPDEAPDGEPAGGGIAAVRAELGDEVVAELGRLPESLALADDARAWHASPKSDVESFFPDPLPDDDALLEGVTERRLVFGHTHLPFRREHRGVELINPGSVGMPLDGDHRAAYALLHDDGRVEHRRAVYPHEEALATLRERFDGEWVEIVARRLESARIQG
ncbi:MAG TPA: metallophosphoesterase family protein [Solirubrobacteraceae bacterium]|jgi:diadenosine tetraphosphatase ApaH/serine/threonine PP2A family protein phosphatase